MKQVVYGWKAVLDQAMQSGNARLHTIADAMLKRIDGMYPNPHAMIHWPYIP